MEKPVYDDAVMALNGIGFKICKIIDPNSQEFDYFAYDSFTPVDQIGPQVYSHKHVVLGRNITEFLHQRTSSIHSRMSTMDQTTVRSNIAALQQVRREYSEGFLWINFLPFQPQF